MRGRLAQTTSIPLPQHTHPHNQAGHERQQARAEALQAKADAPMEADAGSGGTAVDGAAGARHCKDASSSGEGSSSDGQGKAQARWGRCFYTRLPRAVRAPGVQGAALTALNLDKTAALEQALGGLGDASGQQLLGELQFAYVAFLCGQSLEGAQR